MLRSLVRKWCCPDLQADSVADIDLADLWARGIRALLLDLDNTLVQWRSREVQSEVGSWIRQAQEAGFRLCIVSNAGSARRVEPVARELGVPFAVRAGKPSRRAFRHAAALLQVSPKQTAVIGDQVFTDILGGNRAGMLTVLVSPINRRREFISTKMMRLLERAVWRHIHDRPAPGPEGGPASRCAG